MAPVVETAITMLVVFQLKHYICDFPLQTPYMLRKVLPGWDFFLPLLTHAAVHAVFTLAICLYFRPDMWWLCLVDGGVHFFMDRVKAGERYLGRFRDKNQAPYWHALGFDQMVHHLTHYYIIYRMLL